jgi:hypothetical protein
VTLVGGRFEIEREAGAGAMGRVYRARDITSDTHVALKIINGVSDHAMRRFAREVNALVELKHPAIVRYVAHGQTELGQPYLAMEWLDGEVLEDRLANGPLSIAEAQALGRALGEALGVAHARSLVHRDVKPANIWLVGGDPSRPKLLDFGLARDATATLGLTAAGDLLGTPLYMAPEQASCELDIDGRVDVYALGAVLYRCLAGRPPLVAPNLVGLLAKIVLEEPVPIGTLRRDVPASLAGLIMRMLAKRRDARPIDVVAALGEEYAESSAIVGSREQRVVSIMLASKQTAAQASVDATLGSFGGALGLADGSTMVVFSGPESPGDLAARAARYALALRSEHAGVSLATGRAVLSGPTPMGEVIDRAAQQLSDARGTVRIDGETAALVEGRFEIVHDNHGATLVAERDDELDRVRTLLGKPTRCIGRDRELAAIEGYFAECVAESAARTLVVIAEAGVGKSRLAHEMQRRLANHDDAPAVILARCESISATSPFAGIASALRRTGSVTDEFLQELLGIRAAEPSERMRAARENPAIMFEQIRTAVVTWLGNASNAGPVLFVVEDAHWLDEPSSLLIDAALSALAEKPFMVFALARPEFRERKVWTAHRPHELRLDPLARRASERLVRDALGAAATDSIVGDIVGRAGGNALFLEELVRAAATHRVGELPIGVIGTLQLRFDMLPPDARAVVRVASVFGEYFTAAGVRSLLPHRGDVEQAIRQIVDEEIFRAAGDGFAFRHALVREAAYALLTEDDRRTAHALAGEHLERIGDGDPAVIAKHFDLGGRKTDAATWYARAAEHALARNDLAATLDYAAHAQRGSLDATGLGALDLMIAEVQMWRSNLPAAREAGLRALSRLPEGSVNWLIAAGLLITTSGQLGDNATVSDWIRRTMPLEPADDAARSAYVLALARGVSQLAWGDGADLAREAFAAATRVAEGTMLTPFAAARLDFARAYHELLTDGFDEAITLLFETAARYTSIGARRDALQTSVIANMLSAFAGQHERGEAGLQACCTEALAMGATYIADWARFEIATSLSIRGAIAESARVYRECGAAVSQQPLFRVGRTLVECWQAVERRDGAEIERLLTRISDLNVSRRYRGALAAFRAFALLTQGQVDLARERAVAALHELEHAPGVAADMQLTGQVAALVTIYETNAPHAATAIAEHEARIMAIANRFKNADARERFLGVPWIKRIQELRAATRNPA